MQALSSDSYQAILLRSLASAHSLDVAKATSPSCQPPPPAAPSGEQPLLPGPPPPAAASGVQPLLPGPPPQQQMRDNATVSGKMPKSGHRAGRSRRSWARSARLAEREADRCDREAAAAKARAADAKAKAELHQPANNVKNEASQAPMAPAVLKRLATPERSPTQAPRKKKRSGEAPATVARSSTAKPEPPPTSPQSSSYTWIEGAESEDEEAKRPDVPTSPGPSDEGGRKQREHEKEKLAGFLPDLADGDYAVSFDTLDQVRIDNLTDNLLFNPRHNPTWLNIGKALVGLLRYDNCRFEGKYIQLKATDKAEEGYVKVHLLAAFLNCTVGTILATAIGDKNRDGTYRFHCRILRGWMEICIVNVESRKTRQQNEKLPQNRGGDNRAVAEAQPHIGAGEYSGSARRDHHHTHKSEGKSSGKDSGKNPKGHGKKGKGTEGKGKRFDAKGKKNHHNEDGDDGNWGTWKDLADR